MLRQVRSHALDIVIDAHQHTKFVVGPQALWLGVCGNVHVYACAETDCVSLVYQAVSTRSRIYFHQ